MNNNDHESTDALDRCGAVNDDLHDHAQEINFSQLTKEEEPQIIDLMYPTTTKERLISEHLGRLENYLRRVLPDESDDLIDYNLFTQAEMLAEVYWDNEDDLRGKVALYDSDISQDQYVIFPLDEK